MRYQTLIFLAMITCWQCPVYAGGNMAIAMCRNITIQLDASGNYFLDPLEVDDGSEYDIDLTVFPDSFSCTDAGSVIPVTLTASSFDGDDECIAMVTVEEVTPPVMLCKEITVNLDATGNAFILAEDVDNGSFDECAFSVFLSVDVDTFTCDQAGSPVSVTLTGMDDYGNSASCMATVWVQDVTAPEVMCNELTVLLDDYDGTVITVDDVTAFFADACTLAQRSISTSEFTCADLGTNTFTFFAWDTFGNTNSCTMTAVVVDVLGPDIQSCSDALTVHVLAPTGGTAPMSNFASNVQFTENCGIATPTQTIAPGARVGIGTNEVFIWVTDTSGNSNSCNVFYVVEEAASAVITTAFRTNLAFVAHPGLSYKVEYLDAIDAAPQVWTEYTNFTVNLSNDGFYTFDFNDGASNRIYRYYEIFP